MSIIEAENALEEALGTGVKRKGNRTGKLRSKAARVAKGSPEVMVKITGFGKGVEHVKAHLSYITRNAKLELETDRGDILRGKDEIKELFGQWTEDIANAPRHKNQRDTMHMVLSMPEGTPEIAVRNAARAYAKRNFGGNHEYVFALHTDEPHPHVHLTVKMLGFDGKRLNPRKADLQAWRESFAQEMRDQGIDAEATPRVSRGVVRKAEKSVIRHIERGDDRHAPRVPRVKASRVKDAVDELIAEIHGLEVSEKPWEPRIRDRQQHVRRAWLAAAEAFASKSPTSKENQNERPNYEWLDPVRVRAGQRAAAVYQSNLEKHGLRAATAAIARMRDLSRVNVAHNERPAQVFLYSNALDGMGRDGAADNGLRWPRNRPLAIAAGTSGDVNGKSSQQEAANSVVATQIRHLVEKMPPLETERQELKRKLLNQFGLGPRRDQEQSPSQDPRLPSR